MTPTAPDATPSTNQAVDASIDPVAAFRARSIRHERLPMRKLVDIAKAAGCDVSTSRMRFVNFEVNVSGMNVGTIAEEDGVPVLELSRRETPQWIVDGIAAGVDRARRDVRLAAMRGVSGGLA